MQGVGQQRRPLALWPQGPEEAEGLLSEAVGGLGLVTNLISQLKEVLFMASDPITS